MIDIILAIIIVIAIIKGYQKGFIIALFSIIALIIGLAAALKLSAAVADYLHNNVTLSSKWLPFIAFAIVFLIAVILVSITAKLIEKALEITMLGWANRVAGILVYGILYLIIFSIFLFYAEKIHLFNTDSIQASKTYPYIQPLGPKVIDNFGKVIPFFKGVFADLEAFFGKVSDNIAH